MSESACIEHEAFKCNDCDNQSRPKVRLIGQDGNAFMILGLYQRAARKANMPKELQEAFRKEATSGDCNHLLGTVMKYFDVE